MRLFWSNHHASGFGVRFRIRFGHKVRLTACVRAWAEVSLSNSKFEKFRSPLLPARGKD